MRIKHIDALRGIAAILVTFFHLTGSSGLSVNSASYGKYGYLGVEIFFVISGFILPYSMYRTGYNLHNFGRFILKRILRIYPAYIVAVIIGIILAVLTGRLIVSKLAIVLHLVFLNSILGYDWMSPVFWTLAIEFQFYILIGLLYNYFSASNVKSIILICSIALISVFFKNSAFIFHWFPFFALGTLIYNRKFTNMLPILFWTVSLLLAASIICIFGLPELLGASFAFLFILFIKMERKTTFNIILLWLGSISYSLYLVHWELGRAFVAFCKHIPVLGGSEAFRVMCGMCFSIVCGYVLFRFIEKPSIRLSGTIKYKMARKSE